MPKKKQVTFQQSIVGKFIPRSSSPSRLSVYARAATDNRLNAKMAELLALSSSSSSTSYNVIDCSSDQSAPSADTSSVEPPTKELRRKIVTMLDSLKTSDDNTGNVPLSPPVRSILKSQPITFGQLRKANVTSNVTTVVIRSSSTEIKTMDERSKDGSDAELPNARQSASQVNPVTAEDMLTQVYPNTKTVILNESHLPPPPPYPNSSNSVFTHSLSSVRDSLPSGDFLQSARSSNQIVANGQNQQRPPPPSYSSSIANTYRTIPTGEPSRLSSNISTHLYSNIPRNVHLPPSPPTPSLLNISLVFNSSTNDSSVRPPPPRYRSPSSNTRRSASHQSSSDQSPPPTLAKATASTAFDHKFSRFLYGKDSNKHRRFRQRRKAFSDPVKKCIEEANRSSDKTVRRPTSNLQNIDTDKEEQSEEVERPSRQYSKQELMTSFRRRVPRSSNVLIRNSEITRKNLVPASPALKRRIPTFLRVYSQASPTTDPLLQWDLFNVSELETFDMMMGRLYKNENLARVQSYETYRTFLLNLLGSKRL